MGPEEVASLRERFERILENARLRYVPTIILWGPGVHSSAGFQKRLKLKESIKKECPKALVIFPEDPQIQVLTGKYVTDPDLQEVFQAVAADLIFALDTVPGVGEEVARYSRIQNVSNKLFVISTDSNKRGYRGIMRTKLNVEFFSDEELRLCDRASQFCREQIRAWLIRRIAEGEM